MIICIKTVISAYLLMDKETITYNLKRFVYTILNETVANQIVDLGMSLGIPTIALIKILLEKFIAKKNKQLQ